jgi:hypothetical protein
MRPASSSRSGRVESAEGSLLASGAASQTASSLGFCPEVAPRSRIAPYLLSLAGEYRVCSELNKRGVLAALTYGNRKNADVYAIGGVRRARARKVEVKTSQERRFVTNIAQTGRARRYAEKDPALLKTQGLRGVARVYGEARNDPDAPDFWVLFQIRQGRNGEFAEGFFILTHADVCRAQERATRNYLGGKKRWDPLPGVDGVPVEEVKGYEDNWWKIVSRFSGGRSKGNSR